MRNNNYSKQAFFVNVFSTHFYHLKKKNELNLNFAQVIFGNQVKDRKL